jgi:hypothetical protein
LTAENTDSRGASDVARGRLWERAVVIDLAIA